MSGDVERLAEEIIRDVWDDDRHDLWFDATQPPGDRDFGCMCSREPLGHIPEDDYEVIERAHRLALVRERIAAHDAEVAARAAEAAWQVAHEEACRLGHACSTHQPIEVRANFRPWLVAVLSADTLAATPVEEST